MGKSGLSTWVPVWLHVTDSPPDANEAAAAAFKVLEALPFSFCVSACQYLSCSLPFTSPPVILQWFCLSISVSTHPFSSSSSSSSVTPLLFFSFSYPSQSVHLLLVSLQWTVLGSACAIWTLFMCQPCTVLSSTCKRTTFTLWYELFIAAETDVTS